MGSFLLKWLIATKYYIRHFCTAEKETLKNMSQGPRSEGFQGFRGTRKILRFTLWNPQPIMTNLRNLDKVVGVKSTFLSKF